MSTCKVVAVPMPALEAIRCARERARAISIVSCRGNAEMCKSARKTTLFYYVEGRAKTDASRAGSLYTDYWYGFDR